MSTIRIEQVVLPAYIIIIQLLQTHETLSNTRIPAIAPLRMPVNVTLQHGQFAHVALDEQEILLAFCEIVLGQATDLHNLFALEA